jgi:hypothetical protein
MSHLWISVRKSECEVKCFHRIPDLHFATEGNALGDIAYEGGLNVDGLCQTRSQLAYITWGVMNRRILPWLHHEVRGPSQAVSS